jgi:hypothetical protein
MTMAEEKNIFKKIFSILSSTKQPFASTNPTMPSNQNISIRGNDTRLPSRSKKLIHASSLRVGDRVDVEADGVYCPAVIRNVHSNENKVLIHYTGWDTSYDEWIPFSLVPSRIFPAFQGVQKVKVWANLSKDTYPFWPCIAFIRLPRAQNSYGIEYLQQEKKVFIIPIGEMFPGKKYFDQGFWIDSSQLRSFHLDVHTLPWQFPSPTATTSGQLGKYLKRIDSHCKAVFEDEGSIFFPSLYFEQGSFESSLYELVILQGKVLSYETSLLEISGTTVTSSSDITITQQGKRRGSDRQSQRNAFPVRIGPVQPSEHDPSLSSSCASSSSKKQRTMASINNNESHTSKVSTYAKLVLDSFYAHEASLITDSIASCQDTATVANATPRDPKETASFVFTKRKNVPSAADESTLFSKQVYQAVPKDSNTTSHATSTLTSFIPLTSDLTLVNAMLFQIGKEDDGCNSSLAHPSTGLLAMPTVTKRSGSNGVSADGETLFNTLPRISTVTPSTSSSSSSSTVS